MRPVTSAKSNPSGATSSRMVWACCSAKISVGAIKAACAPLSAAHNMGVEGDEGFAGSYVAL